MEAASTAAARPCQLADLLHFCCFRPDINVVRSSAAREIKEPQSFPAPPQSRQMEFSILAVKSALQPGKIGLQKGSDRMRQEQQSIAAALSAVDFKFRFQMTDAGAAHACSVTIQAVSIHDAAAIFRANWLTIENLARRSLAANDPSDIRLEAALAD